LLRQYTRTFGGEIGVKELGSLGMDGARLRRVEEAIARDIAANRYDGAALRVHRRGRLVLDTVQGFAHRGRGTKLSSDAVFVTFSSGKQFTAVSVLQYIEDPNQLLRDLLQAVPQAEIHVLDTPIHRAADVAAARARTQRHYVSVGVEEMATHYFHHDGTVVAGLPHTVLYRPDTPWRAVERRVLRRSRSPFPWVRIRSTPGASR